MKRRDFLTLIGGAAAALPTRVGAQQPANPVIGFLNGGSPYEWAPFVSAFRGGLSEVGYTEGRNVAIEFRWAYGDQEQMPALVRDLLDRRVDVIVTSAGNFPTRAAIQATSTIPIVATFGNETILKQINKSVSNITGVSLIAHDLLAKQFQLLRQLVPKASLIAALVDPVPGSIDISEFQETADKIGQKIVLLPATSDPEIDKAFATIGQRGAGALLIASTAYFLGRRDRLASLAARHGIPTIYPARPYVDAGGLISYGVDREDLYRELGLYTGRILRGSVAPAELPIRAPTKFELALNLKAAKALGITIPPSLVTLADAVIQ